MTMVVKTAVKMKFGCGLFASLLIFSSELGLETAVTAQTQPAQTQPTQTQPTQTQEWRICSFLGNDFREVYAFETAHFYVNICQHKSQYLYVGISKAGLNGDRVLPVRQVRPNMFTGNKNGANYFINPIRLNDSQRTEYELIVELHGRKVYQETSGGYAIATGPDNHRFANNHTTANYPTTNNSTNRRSAMNNSTNSTSSLSDRTTSNNTTSNNTTTNHSIADHSASNSSASSNQPDSTILSFQTESSVVRIYSQKGQTLINIYRKKDKITWLHGAPITVETSPEGTDYIYKGEPAVRIFQTKYGNSPTLQIGDNPIEVGI